MAYIEYKNMNGNNKYQLEVGIDLCTLEWEDT